MVMFVEFHNEWTAAGAWWQLPVTIQGTIMKWWFLLRWMKIGAFDKWPLFLQCYFSPQRTNDFSEWISHSNSYLLIKVAELSCRPEQIDRDFISSVLLGDSLANGQERPPPEPMTFNLQLEGREGHTAFINYIIMPTNRCINYKQCFSTA